MREVIYLGYFGLISLSKFSSLDFILALKKGVFSILFKQPLTKSLHIAEPLIEILYLVLVSVNLGFEKFKVDNLVEYR